MSEPQASPTITQPVETTMGEVVEQLKSLQQKIASQAQPAPAPKPAKLPKMSIDEARQLLLRPANQLSEVDRTRLQEAVIGMQRFVNRQKVSQQQQDGMKKIAEAFKSIVNDREKLMKSLHSLRTLDVVHTILDNYINDAFSAIDDDSGNFFTVKYEPPEDESGSKEAVDQEFDLFEERIKPNKVVRDVLDDLLLQGEYPLNMVPKEGEGITEINDVDDPMNTIGVYHLDEPQYFLQKRGNKLYKLHADTVLHFSMSNRKVRTKTIDKGSNKIFSNFRRHDLDDDDSAEDTGDRAPKFIRVGRSVMYGAMGDLKEYQILKISIILKDIKKMLSPDLVTIGVPDTTDTDELNQIIEWYDTYLQSNLHASIDLNSDDLESFLFSLQTIKALPAYSGGKGGIQSLVLDENIEYIQGRLREVRIAISAAIGFPIYYLVPDTGGEQDQLSTLKTHARYSRKLFTAQGAVRDAVKRLYALHIQYKLGIVINPDYIKVRFKKVLDVEALDYMEYAVAATQALSDMLDVFERLADSPHLALKINSEEFLKFTRNLFAAFGGENLFELDTESIPPDEEDIDNEPEVEPTQLKKLDADPPSDTEDEGETPEDSVNEPEEIETGEGVT